MLNKKYKNKWTATRQTIAINLQRAFYLFQNTSLIDNIKFSQAKNSGIFKLDFRVAGTNTSPKTSGNRVIFSLCNNSGDINILLVYWKDHCVKNQSETQWILEKIKNNFPQYKTIVS